MSRQPTRFKIENTTDTFIGYEMAGEVPLVT